MIPCDKSMKAIVLRVLALIGMLSTTACARPAEPWDAPFAGDPRAILEAAKLIPVPDEQMAIVLLEQHRYVIDENGRTISKVRKVLRIVTEEGTEEWSSIEQEYQPWHESKPEMRARVIGADGTVHWLDGKTIADSPANEYEQNIFSDRRVVRAPLPAVGVGTIVEYEIVTRETGPLEPRKNVEGSLPSDVPSYPYVSFSTGRTWEEIAAKYEAVVDQQIKA